MPIQQWSDNIVVVELSDDPQFTDDLNAVIDLVAANPDLDVALSFAAVTFLNSSNIAKLLRLRKAVVVANGRRLKFCAINNQVWGVFLVTGLDKVFDFSDDIASGLAALQLGA